MKVLEIGPGRTPQAHLIPSFKGAEIVTMDADEDIENVDIHGNGREIPENLHGQFEAVFASHVLEHFPFWDSVTILKEWMKALKPGGEIHVTVPSLEWCAEQLLDDHPSKAVLPMLYGGQDTIYNIHLAGFTMRLLRRCFEEAGMRVTRARSGTFHLQVLGKEFESQQHYVCGKME